MTNHITTYGEMEAWRLYHRGECESTQSPFVVHEFANKIIALAEQIKAERMVAIMEEVAQ